MNEASLKAKRQGHMFRIFVKNEFSSIRKQHNDFTSLFEDPADTTGRGFHTAKAG